MYRHSTPTERLDWNVVVTSGEGEHRAVRQALRHVVRLYSSGYRNVMIGLGEDREAMLAGIAERLEHGALRPHQLGRVVPVAHTFRVDAATFDAQLREQTAALLPQLAGQRFYVRLERRGHKGFINTAATERALGEHLHGELTRRGACAGVTFSDPDAVVAIELLGTVAGVGLLPRDLCQRFPFVHID